MPGITFEAARDIVASSAGVRAMYPRDDFEVADYGWENAEVYVIVAGTHVDVHGIDDPATDFERLTFDAPARLVDKTTGELREIFGLLGRDPAPDLVPIGDVPD
ncbi:hypothetical protein B1R94_26000 [Mycolicibacterium litorale]|nr:hypothetical protein B1R94_26000 [Mycolicibacterium litorale]